MNNKPNLLVPLPTVVEKVGPAVSRDEVDTFGRLKEIRDQSHRIRTIVKAWKDQQTEDRKMRRQYATALLVGLGIQILIMNVIYILVGCEQLKFDVWTTRIFIMAVFGEVASMVFFIVKYLFRPIGTEILELEVSRPVTKMRKGRNHERKEENREH